MTSKQALKELKENAQEICEWELDRLNIIEKDLDKLDKIKKILFEEDLTYIEMTRKIRKVFGYGN